MIWNETVGNSTTGVSEKLILREALEHACKWSFALCWQREVVFHAVSTRCVFYHTFMNARGMCWQSMSLKVDWRPKKRSYYTGRKRAHRKAQVVVNQANRLSVLPLPFNDCYLFRSVSVSMTILVVQPCQPLYRYHPAGERTCSVLTNSFFVYASAATVFSRQR